MSVSGGVSMDHDQLPHVPTVAKTREPIQFLHLHHE